MMLIMTNFATQTPVYRTMRTRRAQPFEKKEQNKTKTNCVCDQHFSFSHFEYECIVMTSLIIFCDK